MTDIEKQFAGNYVRLVNQCRELQADIAVKNKMIDFAIEQICILNKHKNNISTNIEDIKNIIENQALSELVAEQNKKAASCASI